MGKQVFSRGVTHTDRFGAGRAHKQGQNESARFEHAEIWGRRQSGDEQRSVMTPAFVHPRIMMAYLTGALVLSMGFLHPICVALSCLCAGVTSRCYAGWDKTLQVLRIGAPLLLLSVLLNPFFSAQGMSVLVNIGSFSLSVESVVYGLCMGGMLLSMLWWFNVWGSCITTEDVLHVFPRGGALFLLMLSLTQYMTRLILARAGLIRRVIQAQRAHAEGARDTFGQVFKRFIHVSTWMLEDSVALGETMRVRGWHSGVLSSYERRSFTVRDRIVVGLMLSAALMAVVLTAVATSGFEMYPTISGLGFHGAWIVDALYLSGALMIEGWARWFMH